MDSQFRYLFEEYSLIWTRHKCETWLAYYIYDQLAKLIKGVPENKLDNND